MTTNTWRQNLRPASWRGVPFEVAGDEVEFGRNVAIHEFVQRDKPYVEDLGRKTRKFRIDGWICAGAQNNFNPWPQRDALVDAVEQGGVGTLVHPYYGSLRGHITTMGVKQTSSELGGFISLSMDFVEAGELEFRADAVDDTGGTVLAAADDSYTALADEFSMAFGVEDLPGFVLADAVDMVGQFLGVLSQWRRPQSLAAQVAELNLASVGIYAQPLVLAQQVVAIMRDVSQPEAFHQFLRPQTPGIATKGRTAQRANSVAFTHLVQVASLVRTAELSVDFASSSTRFAADSTVLRSTPQLITHNEMQTQRTAITQSFTSELLELSSLQMYQTTQQLLVALRTAAVQHMTAIGEHLARTFITTCCDGNGWNGFMPSLVLAYRHYGLLTDDVINERNEIPNPLFIQPRAAIELLHEVTE
ncbi:DNA circularization N-terminal domain-containing protein [Variovorax sp. 3P27G3]|jgi:prophage DNA circulation protein|uniref:DNA circularization protein n=1 Tax=Variovorax sp. 3P27G3 TaxID=2502214 RepID=UPI0010F92D9C|nr:DNA circularization N-terminal domain-containing protein [Variovorax sp. 3P27G3]